MATGLFGVDISKAFSNPEDAQKYLNPTASNNYLQDSTPDTGESSGTAGDSSSPSNYGGDYQIPNWGGPSSGSTSKSTSSSWAGLPSWAQGYAEEALSLTPWITQTMKGAYEDYKNQGAGIIQNMAEQTGQRLLAGMDPFLEYARPGMEEAARRGLTDGTQQSSWMNAAYTQLAQDYAKSFSEAQLASQEAQLALLEDLSKLGYTMYGALPAFLQAGREATAESESQGETWYSDPGDYWRSILPYIM